MCVMRDRTHEHTLTVRQYLLHLAREKRRTPISRVVLYSWRRLERIEIVCVFYLPAHTREEREREKNTTFTVLETGLGWKLIYCDRVVFSLFSLLLNLSIVWRRKPNEIRLDLIWYRKRSHWKNRYDIHYCSNNFSFFLFFCLTRFSNDDEPRCIPSNVVRLHIQNFRYDGSPQSTIKPNMQFASQSTLVLCNRLRREVQHREM